MRPIRRSPEKSPEKHPARFAKRGLARSPVAFAFLALLFFGAGSIGAGSVVLAAPKLEQFAVPADDGLPLSLWAREVPKPKGVIVLLHGRTWSAVPDFDLQVPGDQRSVMQSLNARGYSAFALDMRGYGKTPRDATGWLTPDRAVRDVAEVIEWLAKEKKIQRPVLLGWSYGSLVSQLVAQRRPELLSALILFGYPRDPAKLVFPDDLAAPARAANTSEAAANDFISPKVTPKRVIDAYVAAALAADPVRVDWRNQMAEFQALDPSKVLVPTLLIHGERDPAARSNAQARLFVGLGTQDKQWVVLSGGDHAALIEDTHAAFIAAIAAFVSRPVR
jgi:pimeloyl-ACP methyl ester carboxylesterase